MNLGQKQEQFSRMIVQLMQWAFDHGYEIRMGDAFRDARVHGVIGEKKGYGKANSCHKSKLALDINLVKNGEFIQTTEGHTELGEEWERMGGSWGGRFNDGNHYSLEHNGMR